MTDLQMVLIIGIPTLSVLLAIWRSDKRIDDRSALVDAGFAKVEDRFDKVDQRFDVVDTENRFFHGTIGEHKEAIATLKRKARLWGPLGWRERQTAPPPASARETYCNHEQ